MWEDCQPEDVLTLKEVSTVVSHEIKELFNNEISLVFWRIPVTAESSMDERDFDALLRVCRLIGGDVPKTAIVLYFNY